MLVCCRAMAKPHAQFRLPHCELGIGEVPLVVGTVSALDGRLLESLQGISSDVVEFRIDKMPRGSKWMEPARAVEAGGLPVIATVRFQAEGGEWGGGDRDRLPLYEQALRNLAAVDVEFKSEIGASVAETAKKLGKISILSFHDFEKTPSVSELEEIVFKAQKLGSIVKISTKITQSDDRKKLESLLKREWRTPLCVIGMGPLGTETRVSFAVEGSCLTYGYLDVPAAPGQLAAVELVEQLRGKLPAYDRYYAARHQAVT